MKLSAWRMPAEQVAVRGREERRAAVGAVDVEPQVPFSRANCPRPSMSSTMPALVVPDGGHDADDALGMRVGGERRVEVLAGEAVVVGGHDQLLDRRARAGPCRCSSARRPRSRSAPRDGSTSGCLARPTSRPTVSPDRLPIEPPDTNAPPEPSGMPAWCGEERQRLVLGDHDAGRLEPARPVETRAGDDHVEEQGVLGRRVGDEGEEARRVDRDDRRGQFVAEEVEDLVGRVALGADLRRELGQGNLGQAAEVQGDRRPSRAARGSTRRPRR